MNLFCVETNFSIRIDADFWVNFPFNASHVFVNLFPEAELCVLLCVLGVHENKRELALHP